MLAWLKVPANISDYRQMCEESIKTPLLVTHFNIIILNLAASCHSVIVIYMDPHSPNKMLFSYTQRW